MSRAAWFWVFVGPFLAGLLLFSYVPIGWSVLLSFFEARNTVTPTDFVGFRNYREMLTDRSFVDSLLTFSLFALAVVPLTYVSALGLALLVNRIEFARSFFRSVFFLPTACSYVVAALVWKLSIFSGVDSGLANTVLGTDIAWLVQVKPPWYWLALITVRLWLQTGFYMILFIAGLQRISQSLYEAAEVDGASGWQSFRYVTLPQLRSTSIAVLLLSLIAAYQAFDEFYNLFSTTGGYPPYARPPLVYLYYNSLGAGAQDFGHGGAGAVILAAVIAMVTLLQGKLIGRERA
ncbi:sugar ABC transporter permease [Pseudonocardiaceae bacterium YIM PH 21723]|nr:sugar ABC transporter permease [Pseudonocardiaceae bacterium YIM PH 21723]